MSDAAPQNHPAVDRKFCFGQKPTIARDAIERAGAQGIEMAALERMLKSSRKSLLEILRRVRSDLGLAVTVRRASSAGPAMCYAELAFDARERNHQPAALFKARLWADRIQAAGRVGILLDEIVGDDTPAWLMAKSLRAIADLGLAWIDCQGTDEHPRRAFARQDWWESWQIATRKKAMAKAAAAADGRKPGRRFAHMPMQRSGQAWAPPQPKVLPQAITPDDVKRTVQRAPKFDDRYQVDPRKKIIGGFADMGPGRYLDD
jgi:hypothetical protein